MRVFFSCGEASGDAYVAELANRIKSSGAEMLGIVGVRGEAAGVKPVATNSDWGAIGVVESLKVSPKIRRGYYKGLAALADGNPGVCVVIDFGYMNIRFARHAKRMGWQVLYFSPPGSWRKDKQGADLPSVSNEIVTPFQWSAEILNQMGGHAHWFGHPLKQMIGTFEKDAYKRTGIAVLPGSRLHEIENNIPTIAKALENYSGEITLSLAPNVSEPELLSLWGRFSHKVAVCNRDLYQLLKSSEVAIVCSGTATLESALCRCPTVVVYRGSKLMELEFRIRRPKFDYISLPNILLEEKVVQELIQWDATPESVWMEVKELLENSETRKHQLDKFEELNALLGRDDALDKTADLILNMMARP